MTIHVQEMLFFPSWITNDGFSKNEALLYAYLIAKQGVYEFEMEQLDERQRDERRYKKWPVPEPWVFDGWFVCTQKEIEECLDIAPSAQSAIIKKLIKRGKIKTKRSGMPSQRFFMLAGGLYDRNSEQSSDKKPKKKGVKTKTK